MENRNRILIGLGVKAAKSRALRNSDDFFDEFVDTLLSLGGVYAKFLQGTLLGTISSRNNGNISKQLSVFEDNPKPDYDPHHMLSTLLGKRADELVITSEEPLGVGSYSAVYGAVHRPTGRKVAVKILRPGVKDELNKDLKFMKRLSYVYGFGAPRRVPIELGPLYANFSKACRREMDFVSEVNFAEEMYERYKDHAHIYIPRMHTDYCTDSVIVQEYVEGLSAKDVIEARAAGHDASEIVQISTDSDLAFMLEELLYETQVAMMNSKSFHGDLHPGNIRFIGNNQIALIDFGIKAEPFSSFIVPSYANKVMSDTLIFDGDFDLVRIIDAHFRYMMHSLFRSIESVHVTAKKDMKEFYAGLIDALGISVDNVSEEKRIEWQKRGSPLAILADLITNFSDYGLTGRVNEQSPQRAIHTLTGMSVAMGPEVHKKVFCGASARSVAHTKIERSELFDKNTVLLPDLAIENIYTWLEKVTSSNPELGYKIRSLVNPPTLPDKPEQASV